MALIPQLQNQNHHQEHQEKNGKLRQEIQDKDKKMSKLKREVAHLSLTNINLQRGR